MWSFDNPKEQKELKFNSGLIRYMRQAMNLLVIDCSKFDIDFLVAKTWCLQQFHLKEII
jgi:hypothetical protein